MIGSFPFIMSPLSVLLWATVAAALYFEIRHNLLGKQEAKLRLSGSSYGIVVASVVTFTTAFAALAWGSESYPEAARDNLALVGTTFMASGILLRYWTVAVLGKQFTNEITILENHRVVTAGPFRWIRHPSYAGSLLFQLGVGLISGSLWALAAALLMVLLAYPARILREEKILVQEFGDEYRGYQRRTSRLIPFLY